MKLRNLEPKDAPLMYEWMQDEDVVCYLNTNLQKKELIHCMRFINKAVNDNKNLHLAIVDDEDTYMGTVSLKNINHDSKIAEFAITIRRCAMGKGYSKEAMQQIINKGIKELGLKRIIWCVSPYNKRAIRFYDKNGYCRIDVPENVVGYNEDDARGLIWYEVKGNNDNE